MNKKQKIERYKIANEKHNRKKNLRNANRKSGRKKRSSKPRLKKIPVNDWEDFEELDFNNIDPVMPLGSNEIRRETEKIAADQALPSDHLTLDPAELLSDFPEQDNDAITPCLVIETSSSMCRVDFAGQSLLCDLRGNLWEESPTYVNPVAVGDWVIVSRDGSDRGVVESILPRRSVLARPYSPDKGKTIEDRFQLVVANVDHLLIVASWREPNIWPALIDRYLITADRNNITAIICLNKTDLVTDWSQANDIIQIYQNLRYKVITTSAVNGDGIEVLKSLLRNSTTVVAGLSGVGKSSLINAVEPGTDIRTGSVSESGLYTGQGRHTTTQTTLWQLEQGGMVIDTPGIKSFGIAGINPVSLASWYPEMVPYISQCKFSDCSHLNEIDCAVKRAVGDKIISSLRYKNYTQLYEELSQG